MTNNTEFLIICTGYNCKQYTEKCYNSIVNQTYNRFFCIMVDDGSTDGNDKVIKSICEDERFDYMLMPENKGAALRRYEAFRECNPDDETVVILLGMDDEMLPHALETINNKYKEGVWMTYGNWVDQYGKGLPSDFKLEFDKVTHKNRDYRKVKYRSTALNTFKSFLYRQIPLEDYKINGNWIDSTTESEVMFSCLEMCGEEKIGIIHDYILLYNRDIPNGTLKRLGVEYKYNILAEIVKRPKRDLYVR